LSDEDRETIIEIARKSLDRFQPKPEPQSKSEDQTEVKPNPKPEPEEKS
jgi:F-type H+-transporting ATPase subunit alpha